MFNIILPLDDAGMFSKSKELFINHVQIDVNINKRWLTKISDGSVDKIILFPINCRRKSFKTLETNCRLVQISDAMVTENDVYERMMRCHTYEIHVHFERTQDGNLVRRTMVRPRRRLWKVKRKGEEERRTKDGTLSPRRRRNNLRMRGTQRNPFWAER